MSWKLSNPRSRMCAPVDYNLLWIDLWKRGRMMGLATLIQQETIAGASFGFWPSTRSLAPLRR